MSLVAAPNAGALSLTGTAARIFHASTAAPDASQRLTSMLLRSRRVSHS